ncbi:extracellular solute-binding protein [Pseudomonas sp. LRF_L74]|uniref:extracellular solute-binding protein n=1 Tax=Pseudomonas sp. LRF_L74 TaxID=3369422 RepID=UPI003F5FAFD0
MRLLSGLLLFLACCQVNAEETLRVLNWKNYIDPQVLAAFEQQTGIRVDYQTFTAAEELDAALAKGTPYDVVVPSHFQLPRLIRAGQLAPLDSARLSHYGSIDPGLLAMLAGVETANRYVAPYLWGAVGLVIEPQLAEANYAGPLPDSWSLLFDPAQVARLKPCGIGMLDAPEETASLWFNYRGRSLTLYGARQIERNMQPLQAIAREVKSLDNETYIKALGEGGLCVAMAWSGHALEAAGKRPNLRFLIPQEGAVAYIDSLAIPVNAAHPDLAYRFIDFLLQPGNAVRNARATQFYSPLASDSAELKALAAERPMQVLGAAERRRIYMLESLSSDQKNALDRAWAPIKAAHHP